MRQLYVNDPLTSRGCFHDPQGQFRTLAVGAGRCSDLRRWPCPSRTLNQFLPCLPRARPPAGPKARVARGSSRSACRRPPAQPRPHARLCGWPQDYGRTCRDRAPGGLPPAATVPVLGTRWTRPRVAGSHLVAGSSPSASEDRADPEPNRCPRPARPSRQPSPQRRTPPATASPRDELGGDERVTGTGAPDPGPRESHGGLSACRATICLRTTGGP
jgi:hypothetical protein